MEVENRSMFYEICRLCLDKQGQCDIFEDCLSHDIYKCTGVKVSLTDNLPKSICANCLDIVNKATELSKLAKNNERYLKSLFGDDGSETTKDSAEDPTNTVTSSQSEENDPSVNPAIEKFKSTRKDLFESSVSEDSMVKTYADSSQETGCKKNLKHKDDITEYICSICKKKFDKWKKLYLHNRLHNKNFSCPITMCEKRFSTRGDVEKHVRTHTGEKPYQCNLCDKSFAQRVTLKAHRETVHSVRWQL